MIRGHGNDKYLYSHQEIRGDFSSNIAFNNHLTAISKHLSEGLHHIGDYPDPECTALRRAVAAHHGLPNDHVLITSGSAEAFYLVAHHYMGAHTGIMIPSFAEYEDACRLYHHRLSYLPIGQLGHTTVAGLDTLWWGTPNNPTGTLTSPKRIAQMAEQSPSTTLVVDYAYTHLSAQSIGAVDPEVIPPLTLLHQTYPSLITIHSLTKAFGIPGLRIGYIVAAPHLIRVLAQYQIPWSVSVQAQQAGLYIMQHYHALLPDVAELLSSARRLEEELSKLSYIEVTPSETNFCLCRLTNGSTAAELKEYLIREHGLLIRDASNFRGLTPYHFRVAVQAPEVTALLIDALRCFGLRTADPHSY